ncbi:MAG: hypothetical protein F9K32_00810 [Desulfobulbaceae bacterium]|nr:MAG: hypothetical protein F9K32_00810 [Desulfobulbaceae bacterium]
MVASGCATPYGVDPAGLRGTYEEVSNSALTSTKASSTTNVVLYRANLRDQIDKNPESVLHDLQQQIAKGDDRRNLRFALAELNFLIGEKLEHADSADRRIKATDSYLLSALYAYSYLFGAGEEPLPSMYDNCFRQACDLYNRALGKGLSTAEGAIALQDEHRELLTGSLQMTVDATRVQGELGQFEKFLLADDYRIRGCTIRNRIWEGNSARTRWPEPPFAARLDS